jgi:hypothetical protein
MNRAPITIYRGASAVLFHVHQGERYADMLCWDEMLGQVATLTHVQIATPRYDMLTPDEYAARRDRAAARRAAQQITLLAPTPLDEWRELVKWAGKRGGEADELLPIEQQSAPVQHAMRLISGYGRAT